MAEIERFKVEENEQWGNWIQKIPTIKFNPEWDVKIIPPFAGAFARFTIDYNGRYTSVYLDCNDSLGCVGEPYWEVYPVGDDVGRCLMNNVDELMLLIKQSLMME